MKKLFSVLILVISLAILVGGGIAFAQVADTDNAEEIDKNFPLGEDVHGKSLDIVLGELLYKYQLDTIQDINCGEISKDDFERVGEAWMGVVHPEEEVHERMDEMMGGEGSESLRNAHIRMGEGYLGCLDKNFYSGVMMGMMGFSSMMPDTKGGGKNMFWGNSQMMGGDYLLGGGLGIFWLVNSILVSILLVALIRYFWRKGDRK